VYIYIQEWDLNMLDKKYEESLQENLRLENILKEKMKILGVMEVKNCIYIYFYVLIYMYMYMYSNIY
jgi:hypothetical protein